LIQYNVLRV